MISIARSIAASRCVRCFDTLRGSQNTSRHPSSRAAISRNSPYRSVSPKKENRRSRFSFADASADAGARKRDDSTRGSIPARRSV